MKIIICGAGQVGGNIARHLARDEGTNAVTVIDTDAGPRSAGLTDAYDVNGIVGFASHPDILERAGARDADMIIAATHSDEVNMVVCQVANSIFSVPREIARLRAPGLPHRHLFRPLSPGPPADRCGDLAEYAVADAGDAAARGACGLRYRGLPRSERRSSSVSVSTATCPGSQHPAPAALRAVLDAPGRRRRHPPRRAAVRAGGAETSCSPATRSIFSPPPKTCHGSWRFRQDRTDGRARADHRGRQHRPARGQALETAAAPSA